MQVKLGVLKFLLVEIFDSWTASTLTACTLSLMPLQLYYRMTSGVVSFVRGGGLGNVVDTVGT